MDVFYIILIALGLVVAAVFVIVLVSYFASKKQALTTEENYIKHLLPGIDCGVCGCTSCAEFAKKVASGEVSSDNCKVNSLSNREKIKRHFVKPIDSNIKSVAFVKCKGGCSCKDKYNYMGDVSCNSIENLHSGIKTCKAGCIGCGDCVKVCPYGAIEISNKGAAKVNEYKCTGCKKCLDVCPNKLITMIPTTQNVGVVCNNTFDDATISSSCSVACIRCETCISVCPNKAISMVNNIPVIDPSKCTSCGKCIASCPKHVISHL